MASSPTALSKSELSFISDRIASDERILAAYLLGSAARGEMRPDSDVDTGVMLMPDASVSSCELADLAADLSFSLGRIADLGLMDSNNLVYAKEALLTGERIFVRDLKTADFRAAALLALYLRFTEDRREIVNAYGG